MTEATPQTKISGALAAAQAEAPLVVKSGENMQQRYKYAKLEDYMAVVKPLLTKYSLAVTFTDVERLELPPIITQKGGTMFRVAVRTRARLIHMDGEFLEIDGWGEGCDNLDKAVFKAKTGARKYLLAALFALATTDDPEADGPFQSQPQGGYQQPQGGWNPPAQQSYPPQQQPWQQPHQAYQQPHQQPYQQAPAPMPDPVPSPVPQPPPQSSFFPATPQQTGPAPAVQSSQQPAMPAALPPTAAWPSSKIDDMHETVLEEYVVNLCNRIGTWYGQQPNQILFVASQNTLGLGISEVALFRQFGQGMPAADPAKHSSEMDKMRRLARALENDWHGIKASDPMRAGEIETKFDQLPF